MILRFKARIKRSNCMVQKTTYVGNAVAVKKAKLSLILTSHRNVIIVPRCNHQDFPNVSGVKLPCIQPSYLPKNVQHTIITVANPPRFDGDKKPNSANTEPIASENYEIRKGN